MSEWQIGRNANLQDAVDCAPPGTVLTLSPGDYRQKFVIRTPHLVLRGAKNGKTRIVFSDSARKSDGLGRPLGTFRSYTVAVTAQDVSMENLTIENDAGDPRECGQQVSLAVFGDRFTAVDSAFLSTQDTVFLGPLPPDLLIRYRDLLPESFLGSGALSSRFSHCRIAGSVDFLFGGGNALFSDCEIRSVFDGRSFGYVAAPSHGREQTEGFRFLRCRFTHEKDVPPASVFLARPWRDYGLASFTDCVYDDHITQEGFDKWGTTDRDRTARFYESPAVSGRAAWTNRYPQ